MEWLTTSLSFSLQVEIVLLSEIFPSATVVFVPIALLSRLGPFRPTDLLCSSSLLHQFFNSLLHIGVED